MNPIQAYDKQDLRKDSPHRLEALRSTRGDTIFGSYRKWFRGCQSEWRRAWQVGALTPKPLCTADGMFAVMPINKNRNTKTGVWDA